jgi:hypothetical protein
MVSDASSANEILHFTTYSSSAGIIALKLCVFLVQCYHGCSKFMITGCKYKWLYAVFVKDIKKLM